MVKDTAADLLWAWCRYGWRYRNISRRPVAEQIWHGERIKREMDMILGKDFADFFLFTSDTIRWAKDNDVAIGPGRGSVAASDVSYMTRITEIDPYRYPGMIFERFMDVTRHDPPDIDVDCSDEERYKVYDYIAYKYGAECVGHIGNFVRYRAKNSLQDVAMVYRIPIAAKETVANLAIERSGGDSRADATLEDTFEMFPAARAVLEMFPDLGKASRLEADVRGMSVHACGLMVANSPLTDICAVYEKDGERVLSIDKIDAEYVGALKLDFLGLSTMGMIARCLRMTGLTLEDLYAIPDDHPGAIEIFRNGDVVGIFQFEGRATRLVNRDVRPDHFMHITDINALSRPGPLFSGQTAEYIEVRHGRKQPTPLHPIVDEITKDTYGQMIYQEHILRCLKEIGDLPWTNVHHIRRIIAKKAGQAAFQQNFDEFAEGAWRLHRIDRDKAEEIWHRLVTSGTYAFNIAHAVSYSMLAFWTAWLKANYPVEFYAASLAKATSADLQFRLMRDALAHSIDVRAPSLQYSKATWRAVPGIGLVAGWQQIPKVGAKTAQRMEEAAGGYGYDDWIELRAIPGIGDKTIARIEAWVEAKDPFGLYRTERRLGAVRRFLRGKGKGLAPVPTHDGAQLAKMSVRTRLPGERWVPGPKVIYMGMVRKVEYKDIVEDERSRTGKEVEEILKEIKRPDLIKRATLHCFDTSDEEVYARVNRFQFPKLQRQLGTIRANRDVVIIAGNRIGGFGTPITVDRIWVLDPD
jgi:DNA polymerase III subunit alpha